jgi:arabinofuranosyltransferase
VQVFTHPLWMLLLTVFYVITKEGYFTLIAVSILVSALAVYLVAFPWVQKKPAYTILILALLITSKAFIDFSTSGLENPLSYLLTVLFLWVYFERLFASRTLLVVTGLFSLLLLTRQDYLLLFLPCLIDLFLRATRPLRHRFSQLLLGLVPFLGWTLFSLFYYGFPFPNTAYAKLTIDVPFGELTKQGLFYLFNSLNTDPLTILCIGVFFTMVIVWRKRSHFAVAVGIVLYLLYIVSIGGDFMSGRFLAVPFLVAVMGLVQLLQKTHWQMETTRPLLMAGGGLILFSLFIPTTPLRSTSSYPEYSYDTSKERQNVVDPMLIADERGYYYPETGLLRTNKKPTPTFAAEAEADADNPAPVVIKQSTGFYGFYAKPGTYIVDQLALSDPLLARLPSQGAEVKDGVTPHWRPGHFYRKLPCGYLETLQTGQNVICDADLKLFYDKIILITRGPLFSGKRLATIAKMNLHGYDFLVKIMWNVIRKSSHFCTPFVNNNEDFPPPVTFC